MDGVPDSARIKVHLGEVAVAVLVRADGTRLVVGPRPPSFLGWLKKKLRGER